MQHPTILFLVDMEPKGGRLVSPYYVDKYRDFVSKLVQFLESAGKPHMVSIVWNWGTHMQAGTEGFCAGVIEGMTSYLNGKTFTGPVIAHGTASEWTRRCMEQGFKFQRLIELDRVDVMTVGDRLTSQGRIAMTDTQKVAILLQRENLLQSYGIQIAASRPTVTCANHTSLVFSSTESPRAEDADELNRWITALLEGTLVFGERPSTSPLLTDFSGLGMGIHHRNYRGFMMTNPSQLGYIRDMIYRAVSKAL